MVCEQEKAALFDLYSRENNDMIAITADKNIVFVLRDKTTSPMRKVELH